MKKLIIFSGVLVLIGVAFFFLTSRPEVKIAGSDSINIDGKATKIEYTDDNFGEQLIIKSDSGDYPNQMGGIKAYFSVTNISANDQDVAIAFSFPSSNKKYLNNLYEYGGEKTVTTTLPPIPQFVSDRVGIVRTATTTIEEVKTTWKPVTLGGFTATPIARKDTKETTTNKEGVVTIKAGQTKFLMAEIAYGGIKGKEEFFIEAFGSLGAYGHLDPWTFEDKFNSDTKSTGNLSGQDSWAVNGNGSVSVITADKYEGDQGVIVTPGGSGWTSADYYPAQTGTFYAAMMTKTASESSNGFNFYDTPAYTFFGTVYDGAGNIDFRSDTQTTEVVTGYTTSRWYVFKFVHNAASNQATCTVFDGTSWGSDTTISISAGMDSIDLINNAALAGKQAFYFDTITPTDPTPAPAAPSVPENENIIIFD